MQPSRLADSRCASNGTDVSPVIQSITFNSTTNWFFGATTAGLGAAQSDFLSATEHELGHVLGFNAGNRSWERWIVGNSFTGPATEAANNGLPVAVSPDHIHWAQGVQSNGIEVGMEPNLANGTRRLFGAIDFAALQDMGWDTTGVPNTIYSARQIMTLTPKPVGTKSTAVAAGIGRIASPTDVNVYRVYVAAGDTLTASVSPRPGGTNVDTFLKLFDSSGALLASGNQAGAGGTDSLHFLVPRTDYYYVAVSSAANQAYNPLVANSGPGGPVGDYLYSVGATTA